MRQGVGPRLTAKLNRPRRQNRGPCLRGNEFRRLLGDDIGIEQHIDLHDDISYAAPAATTGFCHPPGGETAWLTSPGPQELGSYS
jgi:hypothetical protein